MIRRSFVLIFIVFMFSYVYAIAPEKNDLESKCLALIKEAEQSKGISRQKKEKILKKILENADNSSLSAKVLESFIFYFNPNLRRSISSCNFPYRAVQILKGRILHGRDILNLQVKQSIDVLSNVLRDSDAIANPYVKEAFRDLIIDEKLDHSIKLKLEEVVRMLGIVDIQS